jgi:hypothetical protein
MSRIMKLINVEDKGEKWSSKKKKEKKKLHEDWLGDTCTAVKGSWVMIQVLALF